MSEEQVAGVVDPEAGAVVNPGGSEGAAVESVPETPEVNETEEFFQTKYQDLVGSLKKGDPEVYAKFNISQQQEPDTGVRAPQSEITGKEGDDEYLTVGQMRQLQQEQLQQLDQRNREMSERQRMAELQAQYQEEWNAANNAMLTTIEELKLPDNVVKDLRQKVDSYRINVQQPTGPSGYARAFMDMARTHKPTPVEPEPTDPAQIAALDAARQQGLMTQPNGGRLGVSQPNPSQEVADMIAPDDAPYVYNGE